MRFKALRGSPEGKAQRGQYLLAVDLGHYSFIGLIRCITMFEFWQQKNVIRLNLARFSFFFLVQLDQPEIISTELNVRFPFCSI